MQLLGGLGNQMFQYAAGKALATHHKTEFKIDTSGFKEYALHDYVLDHFMITAGEVSESELPSVKERALPTSRIWRKLYPYVQALRPYHSRRIFDEPYYHFNKRFLKLPPNVYIRGYFQSERYFKDIEDIIRKEFVVKQEYGQLDQFLAEKLKTHDVISVHFRRGDYVTNKGINKLYGTPSFEYYEKSIQQIAARCKNPYLFIFSNDSAWVKENFTTQVPKTFISDFSMSNFQELTLMSKCHHNVIANSSFSWWGAWLNQNPSKIVHAPSRWFVTKRWNTKDVIPKNWTQV